MKINVKALEGAIKAVTGVTASPHVQISCNGDLSVMSSEEGKYAKVIIEKKSKGKWKTRLIASVLLDLIKGSAEVEVDMKDQSTMKVNGARSNGEIKCMPWEAFEPVDRKGESSAISEKGQHAIMEAMSVVGITDIHEDGGSNFVFLKMNKDGMVVSRFDSYHMAYYETSEIKSKKPIEITAAVESFDTVTNLAGKNSYSFSMTDSLRAWNEDFECSLPLIQSENQQNLDTVRSLIKSLKTSNGEMTVAKDDLFEALEKCAAVHEAGSSVGVVADKKGVKLNIKTTYGQVTASVEGKAKGKFGSRLDPHLVMDTLRPIKDKELTIKMNDNLAFTKVKDEGKEAVYAFVLIPERKEKESKGKK